MNKLKDKGYQPIKIALENYFPNKECTFLFRPFKNKKQSMNEMQFSQLRSEFKE